MLEKPVAAIVQRVNPTFYATAAAVNTAPSLCGGPRSDAQPAVVHPSIGSRALMWNPFFQRGDFVAIKPEIVLTIFGLAFCSLISSSRKSDKTSTP